MELCTQENGLAKNEMATVIKNGPIVQNMKGTGKMAKPTASAN
jgi:hypothetical protein